MHTPPRADEPGFIPGLGPDLDGGVPLFNVVYCSRAAGSVDDAAVERILQSARRRNPAWGITGLLVFGSGLFFQWLEGPRPGIEALMALLRSDPRHTDIVLLSEGEEVRDRLFPDWDMELVGPEHVREVLQDALETAEAGDDPAQVQALQRLLQGLDASPV